MIKVSVMYPNGPDARFDDDYYRDRHMPMVKELMGDSLMYYTIDKGMAGGAPASNAPYIAMGHLFCDSVDRPLRSRCRCRRKASSGCR